MYFFLFCALVLEGVLSTEGLNAETELLIALNASGYNPRVRPVEKYENTINVALSIQLQYLLDIDEKEEIMMAMMKIRAEWHDELLYWDPDDYEGLRVLSQKTGLVWTPDIYFGNSVNGYYQRSLKEDFFVRADYDGNFYLEFVGIFKTYCDLNLSKFPFDTQTCPIVLGTWAYPVEEQHLYVSQMSDLGAEHALWDLENYDHSDISKHYSKIEISFTFSRKSLYYSLNIIVPTCFLILIALGVFLLPPDCGEKASLGVTVLLSFVVLQVLIADSTPKTSENIPRISYLIAIVMAMSTVSLIGAVLSISLTARYTGARVPLPLRCLFLQGLARLFCMRKCCGSKENASTSNAIPKNVGAKPSRRNYQDREVELNFHGQSGPFPYVIDRQAWTPPRHRDHSLPRTDVTGSSRELKAALDILQEVRAMNSRAEEQEKEQSVMEEWKLFAMVVDRILFLISLVVVILTIIAVLS